METQTAIEPRTYYSRSQGLVLHPSKGERVMVDGQLERINEVVVEFQQCDPEFGSYTTDDPKVIAFMEKRIETVKDVMNVEQYNDAILPDNFKIDMLRQENTNQSRLIEEQNRLIAELKRGQTKIPVPTKQ